MRGEIGRRSFLRRAALSAASPALAATGTARAAATTTAAPARPRLEALTCDHFAPRIGRTIRIEREGGSDLRVRLAEATELRAPGGGAPEGRTPFSLMFEGRRGDRLAQGTYRVAFGSIGTFPLLLVPVGPPGRLVRYEAVFG